MLALDSENVLFETIDLLGNGGEKSTTYCNALSLEAVTEQLDNLVKFGCIDGDAAAIKAKITATYGTDELHVICNDDNAEKLVLRLRIVNDGSKGEEEGGDEEEAKPGRLFCKSRGGPTESPPPPHERRR